MEPPTHRTTTLPPNATVTIDPNNPPTEPVKLVVTSENAQGFDPWWKDFIDAVAKLGTLAGLILAAWAAFNQFTRNRELRQKELEERKDALEQRQKELKWKKADLARTVLSEMRENSYAVDAMSMIDWSGRDYYVKATRTEQGKMQSITSRDVLAALRVAELHFDDKESYIRDCFDQFFGVMQVLEHYIEIELIDPADVIHPFDYYASLMKTKRRAFLYFIDEYHPKAGEFLNRLPQWVAVDAEREQEPDQEDDAERAYFMFDCPPGKERFIFMLDDPDKIRKAREEVLSNDEELHVTGELVDGDVFYNQPWDFYLEPATIDFVKDDYELADRINKRVEQQLPRDRATFSPNKIWHFGGSRLLAEIPTFEFKQDEYLNHLQGKQTLHQQRRAGRPNNNTLTSL